MAMEAASGEGQEADPRGLRRRMTRDLADGRGAWDGLSPGCLASRLVVLAKFGFDLTRPCLRRG